MPLLKKAPPHEEVAFALGKLLSAAGMAPGSVPQRRQAGDRRARRVQDGTDPIVQPGTQLIHWAASLPAPRGTFTDSTIHILGASVRAIVSEIEGALRSRLLPGASASPQPAEEREHAWTSSASRPGNPIRIINRPTEATPFTLSPHPRATGLILEY